MNAVIPYKNLQKLQEWMLQFPQVEVETEHYFAGGMYAREVWMPAKALIVGRVHKQEHLFSIIEGMMTVIDESGSFVYCAPHIGTSHSGVKRVVYAHVASRFVTFHRLDDPLERDLKKIESEIAKEEPNSPYLTGNLLKQKVLVK